MDDLEERSVYVSDSEDRGEELCISHGWTVTTNGLYGPGHGGYKIEASLLGGSEWIAHMAQKSWVNVDHFVDAFYKARELHRIGSIDRTVEVTLPNLAGSSPRPPREASDDLADSTIGGNWYRATATVMLDVESARVAFLYECGRTQDTKNLKVASSDADPVEPDNHIDDLVQSKEYSPYQPIPENLRFEVFKRDSFKCQHCGAAVPDVLLHINQIDPVANREETVTTNLVTLCMACHLANEHRILQGDSPVMKERQQLEELQERREQLKMMMEWQRGLIELHNEEIDELAILWGDLAPGWTVNDNGRKTLERCLQQFTLEEIVTSMRIAASQYLIKDENSGEVSGDSWELAFARIGGICGVRKTAANNPDLARLYYIRGIVRQRFDRYDGNEALHLLKVAASWAVPLETLSETARIASSWSNWKNRMLDSIQVHSKGEAFTS